MKFRLTVFKGNGNPTCIIGGASSWMWVVGDHSREPQDEMNFLVKVKVNTSVIGSPSWIFCGSTRPLTLHAPETLSLTGYQKTLSSLEDSSPWKLHRLSLASECTDLGSGSEETRGQTLQLCLERRASTCLQLLCRCQQRDKYFPNLHCLLSSMTLWRPSMLTRTARGTFCSPTADNRALSWVLF